MNAIFCFHSFFINPRTMGTCVDERKCRIEFRIKMKASRIKIIVTVLKYSSPVCLKLAAISWVVMTAATGCPLPMGFPMVTISGITSSPYNWKAHIWEPTLPNPTWTSSAMQIPPASRTWLNVVNQLIQFIFTSTVNKNELIRKFKVFLYQNYLLTRKINFSLKIKSFFEIPHLPINVSVIILWW